MKLYTIGSSTKGACYVITSQNEALILEAGILPDHLWKAVNFDLKKVSGCLISHPSNETCSFAREYAEDLNVYSSAETIRFLNIAHFERVKAIKAGETYQIGDFLVKPFELKHSVKNFGYFINHAETGRIIYLTHTSNIPYVFNGVNHLILECNYLTSKLTKNLKNEEIRPILSRQIINNRMSFETVKSWLSRIDLSDLKNILLCNVSEKNGAPELFKDEITLQTKINTNIAVSGLTIDLKF